MNTIRTHYDNLKVSRDAPDFVIHAAYKALSKKYHPDLNPGVENNNKNMAIINESYRILSNPISRRAYDASIREREASFNQTKSQNHYTTRREYKSIIHRISSDVRRIIAFFIISSLVLLWLHKSFEGPVPISPLVETHVHQQAGQLPTNVWEDDPIAVDKPASMESEPNPFAQFDQAPREPSKKITPKHVKEPNIFDQFDENSSKQSKAMNGVHPIVPISQGIYENNSSKPLIAPLKIVTPDGQDKFYIKIYDKITNIFIMSVFIYGGSELSFKVPLGDYVIRYSMGVNWYGDKLRFGVGAKYIELDDSFIFNKENGQINGYVVELIRQKAGNLEMKAISEGEF
jgi:curved DNA-binding protein CbpA